MHLQVLKTYKMYIDGAFVRGESNRYQVIQQRGQTINLPRASHKDFRNAVSAAKKAFESWSRRSAFNRGQIIYRIAEMLEARRPQFKQLLQALQVDKPDVQIDKSIDLLIYYAGWSDKYQQVFSNLNSVEDYFNVSTLEPIGTLGILAPTRHGLVGICGTIALSLVSANTSVILVTSHLGALALTFAEVLHTSDVPKGTLNILTQHDYNLLNVFSTHLTLKGLVYYNLDLELKKKLKTYAAESIKILVDQGDLDWFSEKALDPHLILNLQQVKTLWYPIGL